MDRKKEFETLKQEYREVRMDDNQYDSYKKAIHLAGEKGKMAKIKISMGALSLIHI